MRRAVTATDADHATTDGDCTTTNPDRTTANGDRTTTATDREPSEGTLGADSGDRSTPELPDLDPGVRLLSTDDETMGALYSLVVDHLLSTPGRAWWVDAGGRARTRRLASVAPSGRLLDRIRVARGFTAFQHLALVETLGDRHGSGGVCGGGDGDGGREDGGGDDEGDGDGGDPGATEAPASPALVVAPAIDAPYRAGDLRAEERREMLVRSLAVLSGIARRHDCPVLVTRTGDDGLAEPVAAAARERIRCETTSEGPRFVADGFETAVYPVEQGWVQTTFAFWRRVLRARAADRAREPGPSDTPTVAPPDGPAATAADRPVPTAPDGPATTGR